MAWPEVLFIAVGLAMDCFAVAVSTAISQSHKLEPRLTLTMAFMFGGFQTAMTLAGWAAGQSLLSVIAGFDHWVAFVLLAFVGAKMLREAFSTEERRADRTLDPGVLIILAFATSLDALAVGLSLALLRSGIFWPVMAIGAVSLIITLAGVSLGRRIGKSFGRKAEVFGGLILIAIGMKVLLEHLH